MGAGVLLSKIANTALENNLTGIEFACGIPGTIGGAIRMNAGAHGKEMKDIVIDTTYIGKDGTIHELKNVENEFGNRTSIFAKDKTRTWK